MYEISFEDRGQDFLRWTVNDQGRVIRCEPFQGWMWCGSTVVAKPEVGGQVEIRSRDGASTHKVIYRVRRIRGMRPRRPNAMRG